MIRRKKHSCHFDVQKAIIHKLSRKQVFLLCVMALAVLGLVGIFAPSVFMRLM